MNLNPTLDWDGAIENLLYIESQLEIDEDGFDIDFSFDRLWELDGDIKDGIFGFVKIGLTAEHIRRLKLWEKAGFKDFADYCKRGLHKTFWSVNRTIDAAQVVMYLIRKGFKILPQCEAQCRPLITVANRGIDTVANLWRQVLSHVKPENITMSSIESVVNPLAEDKQPKGLSKETLKLIAKQAAKEGKSPDDLIHELLRERDQYAEFDREPQPIDPNRIEITPEQEAIIDSLDRQWKAAPRTQKKTLAQTQAAMVDGFDRFMDRLVGQFIPPPTARDYG